MVYFMVQRREAAPLLGLLESMQGSVHGHSSAVILTAVMSVLWCKSKGG